MTATFNAVNTTATFAGGFVNNGNSNFVKAGGGAVEIDNAPTLANNSTLSVTTGTLRFNVVSGTPTIGTGVTAVVSSGATLELAGSVSALANGANRVNITSNSNAPGILILGTNQQVGNIDGDWWHLKEPWSCDDRRQRRLGQPARKPQAGSDNVDPDCAISCREQPHRSAERRGNRQPLSRLLAAAPERGH